MVVNLGTRLLKAILPKKLCDNATTLGKVLWQIHPLGLFAPSLLELGGQLEKSLVVLAAFGRKKRPFRRLVCNQRRTRILEKVKKFNLFHEVSAVGRGRSW
jgi:hypothetical protein